MTKPVSPSVADVPPLDIEPAIRRVNEALSRPWTQRERTYGRTVDDLGDEATSEAVAAAFRRAGWVVAYDSNPYSGSGAWTFKPTVPPCPVSAWEGR